MLQVSIKNDNQNLFSYSLSGIGTTKTAFDGATVTSLPVASSK